MDMELIHVPESAFIESKSQIGKNECDSSNNNASRQIQEGPLAEKRRGYGIPKDY